MSIGLGAWHHRQRWRLKQLPPPPTGGKRKKKFSDDGNPIESKPEMRFQEDAFIDFDGILGATEDKYYGERADEDGIVDGEETEEYEEKPWISEIRADYSLAFLGDSWPIFDEFLNEIVAAGVGNNEEETVRMVAGVMDANGQIDDRLLADMVDMLREMSEATPDFVPDIAAKADEDKTVSEHDLHLSREEMISKPEKPPRKADKVISEAKLLSTFDDDSDKKEKRRRKKKKKGDMKREEESFTSLLGISKGGEGWYLKETEDVMDELRRKATQSPPVMSKLRQKVDGSQPMMDELLRERADRSRPVMDKLRQKADRLQPPPKPPKPELPPPKLAKPPQLAVGLTSISDLSLAAAVGEEGGEEPTKRPKGILKKQSSYSRP